MPNTNVKKKPDGVNTISSYLTVKGAAEAIDFYKKAFGAQEMKRSNGPDGKIMHAQLKIGDSMLMLSDEFPDMGCCGPEVLGGSPVQMWVYVDDADAVFKAAVSAGAEAKMPMTDAFWGDRWGMITDPFGHRWSICTHIEDVSPEEMKRRQEEFMKQPASCK